MTNTIKNSNCKTETKVFNHLPSHFVNYVNVPASRARRFWLSNHALTNVKSLNDTFIVELATPGFKKEDLTITLDKSNLKISGSKNKADDKFILREYQLDHFERVFALPDNIDESSLQAKVENGILSISMQVIPAKLAQTITIN
jgi:HSP20 family protein